MDEFKPQRWHVEFADNVMRESFATRKVAEETAIKYGGMFWLCDCPNRDCTWGTENINEIMVRNAGL